MLNFLYLNKNKLFLSALIPLWTFESISLSIGIKISSSKFIYLALGFEKLIKSNLSSVIIFEDFISLSSLGNLKL